MNSSSNNWLEVNNSSAQSRRDNDSKREHVMVTGIFLENLAPVPHDPKLDPPQPFACFNCWRTNHCTKNCRSPRKRKHCRNCGRKFVDLENCPRCRRAYCEYIEEQEHLRAKSELLGKKFHPSKKLPSKPRENARKKREYCSFFREDAYKKPRSRFDKASRKDVDSVERKIDVANGPASFVEQFENMDLNGREVDDYQSFSSNRSAKEFNHEDSSFVTNGKIEANKSDRGSFEDTGYKVDLSDISILTNVFDVQDEDYKDIIVDENEKTEMSCATGDTVERFLDLMRMVKNLPIEAQTVAVRCFINAQKKQTS